MKHIFWILFCVSFTINLVAQPLPQGYFRNPMDFDIGLSATFAEFRNGHFHAGLDMRTGGAIGKPVYAAADGYVAKVSVSPWGGGKILYIKHPNGYTSVYMHLNDYAGAIGRAVLKEQYRTQSFSIIKLFEPDELPVKKGQLIAHSGNTGGSGGPHLHFELRRGGEEDLHTHAVTINPLRFGISYNDNLTPVIRGIRLYPTDGQPVDLAKSDEATIAGPFYLGIYATDAAEGSTARNGVDHLEVFVDGELFFKYMTSEFPLDSGRISNALIDHPHFLKSREAYLLTRQLPGARGGWIPVCKGDGILRFAAGSTHRIAVRAYDIKDNLTERTFTVKVAPSAAKQPTEVPGTLAASYDAPFSHRNPTFTVQMPPLTLYADDRLLCEATEGGASIRPTVNNIPPHLYYSLSIKGALPGVPADKVVIAYVNGSKTSAQKTTHSNGWFTAKVRDWGRFTLMADTTAPRIRPVNFSESKPMKSSQLRVKINDNLSGIETYNCYLNGQWILAEYDGKSATLTIDTAEKTKGGANKLRIAVVDAAGNVADVTYIIRKT